MLTRYFTKKHIYATIDAVSESFMEKNLYATSELYNSFLVSYLFGYQS